jgi:predicted LPLAT superfamily acyltransferase
MAKSKNEHWSVVTERGSSIGIEILFVIYNLFGKPAFYLILMPILLYFYLTGREQRLAVMKFQQKVSTQRKISSGNDDKLIPFLQYFEFGRSALDKITAWMGKISIEDIVFNNKAQMLEIVAEQKGGVILTSHLGNMEVCRALSEEVPQLKVNALVHTQNAVKFNQLLQSISPTSGINLIEVSELGPETAMKLFDKIEQGEYVAIVGDRTSIALHNRIIEADLLGEKAYFPEGPFILASILKSPVYFMSCIRTKKGFAVDFIPYKDKLILKRNQRQESLQLAVQDYADWLSALALKAPYQWFNFFDIWKKQ